MCCPPRSRARRAWNTLWRRGKRDEAVRGKGNWSPELVDQFWRFWELLVHRAQRIEENGRLDVEEINKIFGWE
jgi:hypothetical protein